jgi:hypothetical protein
MEEGTTIGSGDGDGDGVGVGVCVGGAVGVGDGAAVVVCGEPRPSLNDCGEKRARTHTDTKARRAADPIRNVIMIRFELASSGSLGRADSLCAKSAWLRASCSRRSSVLTLWPPYSECAPAARAVSMRHRV